MAAGERGRGRRGSGGFGRAAGARRRRRRPLGAMGGDPSAEARAALPGSDGAAERIITSAVRLTCRPRRSRLATRASPATAHVAAALAVPGPAPPLHLQCRLAALPLPVAVACSLPVRRIRRLSVCRGAAGCPVVSALLRFGLRARFRIGIGIRNR